MPILLFFNKKKTILRDLVPEGYIDIHSHLLPGIDDGAKNIEDSLYLLNSLQEIGFNEIITTPHIINTVWNNTADSIINKKQETQRELDLKIPFKAAAEYMMDDSFSRLFKNEKLLTLKDNYVLVEMSYLNAPMQLYDILFELQVAGYKPVLAHPERYVFYHKNFNEYTKLKKAGCLFQLNLLSTVGYYGEGVFEAAEQLLAKGMIDFTGSDVHHKNHVAAFDSKIKLKETIVLKEAMKRNIFFRQ